MTDDPVALARGLEQIAGDIQEDYRHQGGAYHACRVRAIAVRLRAHPEGVTEWQPIETAPKDGTSILGYDGLGIAIMEWWEPDQEALDDGATASWCSHSNTEEEFIEAPTHWMPLPASPNTKPTTEDELQAAGSGRGLG